MPKRKFSPAQQAYIQAKAEHDTLEKLAEKIQIQVLAKHEFYTEPDDDTEQPERITHPMSDYRMSDDDFIRYLKLCYAEYQKHGIAPKGYDTVVTHEAWLKLKKAEQDLIEWGYSILRKMPEYKKHANDLEALKEHIKYNIEAREKLIDLTLQLSA